MDIKYRIATQTYMEVFDYLIKNNLFKFQREDYRDFLQSRIVIGEFGFVLQTQNVRGNWDNVKQELVPAIYVLKVLTDIIDDCLQKMDIPASSTEKYAYFGGKSSNFNGGKPVYYSSYRELLQLLMRARQLNYYDLESIDLKKLGVGGIDNISVRLSGLAELVENLPVVEKRELECYARVEEELAKSTSNLIRVDDEGFPCKNFSTMMDFVAYFDDASHHASLESYVDWDEFKDCVYRKYDQLSSTDWRRSYSVWARNNYLSELGLDGLTI